jgi:RHS repeat-associated protein
MVIADSISGLNVGFPGQYYDAGRGTWNNGYRDYSASLGRYIESDPIGLAAGTNTYAYVGGKPLIYVDPYGLWAWGDPLPQGLVDGVTGFGDGVYRGITFGLGNLQDVRDLMGIDGGVDPCSAAYRYSHIAGEIEGAAALGGSLASKSFVPGGWTNSNRYLRIGYGRNGGDSVFRAAGQWVKAVTGDAHFDFWTAGKW